MNVHGASDNRVRRAFGRYITSRENVNYFIAPDSKNRRSQDLLRFRIDADFDETLCLTFFVGPAHLAHRIFRGQGRASRFPYLSVRHTASAQRRINI